MRLSTATLLSVLCSAACVLLAPASARAADHYCTTSAQLQTAIDNAVGGDTITLDVDSTFTGPFLLKAGLTSEVVIRSSAHALLPAAGRRITAADDVNMPLVLAGSSINQNAFDTVDNADNWKLWGLEIRDHPSTSTFELVKLGDATETVAANQPNNITIDQCWIHATKQGIVRGIRLDTQAAVVKNSRIEDFRRDGVECQAIASANGPGPWTIDNNYLSAVGENFITGGGDYGSAEMAPADLTFTRNFSEAKEKYNPWNFAAFDTTDGAAVTSVLSCALSSSGTNATCAAHGVPVDSLGVLKITSGPQTGQVRTVGVNGANTFDLRMGAFSADQSGVTATFYKAFPFKNNFELKTLDGGLIEGNVFKGSWPAGQSGEAIVLTVRNQPDNQDDDFVNINDVVIRNNKIVDASGGFRLLTHDVDNNGNVRDSGTMARVTIEHNLHTNHNLWYPGATELTRLYAISNVPDPEPDAEDIVIRHNTVVTQFPDKTSTVIVGSVGSDQTGDVIGFVFNDNLVLFGEYGIKGNGINDGNATIAAFFPGAAVTGNVFVHPTLSQTTLDNSYPTGNQVAASYGAVQFNNAAAGDYSLATGSPYKGDGSDGADPGVNMGVLAAVTAGAEFGVWDLRTNVASAAHGGVATASSEHASGNYPASGANNGDRRGLNWGARGGWNDATENSYSDSLEVAFAGSKTIDEIDVFTVQDNFSAPADPTETMTFSQYGVTQFQLQYWDGSNWQNVSNGFVTGNNLVWRKFVFTPITTTKIKLVVSNALGGYSRIAEVEAWQVRGNHALAANGGSATASSTINANFPASAVNNGDRKGLNWGSGGGWNDGTLNSFPDSVEVAFGGAKIINEIDVVTLQDNFSSPAEPTETTTFSLYGITQFQVQYWDGAAWVTPRGGSVTGNNRVWRRFTFTPVMTTKVRVLVTSGLDGYSRITEVEAY